MSTAEFFLREFVNERLTAAAEEIFALFKQTVVKYEDEVDRQRRLLDIVRKPKRIELPQQHVCVKGEEGHAEQQLCIQERNSSLDQEDAEPPQIKQEQEELWTSQEGEQLVLSLVEFFREFVSERLTAAATEEIFRAFKNTIVKYEEEVDRQCRLLDIIWKPEIKLHRIELPQQHVCVKGEEGHAEQQLCIQKRKSSLDQEDAEPPQMKEEQEELWTSQEGERLVLKQETETFMLTSYEESGRCKDQSLYLNPVKTPEKEIVVNIAAESSVGSEQKSHHHFLLNNSSLAKCQDYEGGKHRDSGSPKDSEPRGKRKQHICKSNVYNSTVSQIHCNIPADKQALKCDTCGKEFKYKSVLLRHMRCHTGEKPYSCSTCGKRFTGISGLNVHIRNHTGERPFSCKTCGKDFTSNSVLKVHMRMHTGERPYLCQTCGNRFSNTSKLKKHIRLHTYRLI